MKRLIICLILLSLLSVSNSFAAPSGKVDLPTLFYRGNEAYQAGNYAEAIANYQAIIEHDVESGELHYNLGNSYFRSGKIGAAIFHYRKAKQLLPRDADISFNLNYAREKAKDKIERPRTVWTYLSEKLAAISIKESYFGLAGCALLIFVLSILLMFRRTDIIRYLRWVVIVLLLIFTVSLLDKEWRGLPFGVVQAETSKAYSGTGKDNILLFTLHQGAEVAVIDRSGPVWVHVGLADGKQGWVQAKDLLLEKRQ